jgi:hypothetical protein
VSDRIAQDQIARLEASVDSDPGASEFSALAEVLRRSGRPQEAEGVARRGLDRKPGCLEGSVALALALLDQGRVDEARRELASRAADSLAARGFEAPESPTPEAAAVPAISSGFDVEVTEGELEWAFDVAEPDRDQLVDADRVAQDAMREANLERPEALGAVSDPIFTTRTMADLLDRQGDPDSAARIRAALELDAAGAGTPPTDDRDRRERTIASLESWLANLRREP